MTPEPFCPANYLRRWVERIGWAARTGNLLDLSSPDCVDPADGANWSAERSIPSEALRYVLAATDSKTADPRGLRIRGARFRSVLNLAHIDFPRPLHFLACAVHAQMDLSGAKVKELSFRGSEIRDLLLDQAIVAGDVVADEGFKSIGTFAARGVKIGGRLDMSGACLRMAGDTALDLDSAQIGGELLLKDGFDACGEVMALAVSIGGQLNLSNAVIRNPGGDALSLDSAHISGGVIARRQFTAEGTVRALEAKIGGPLDLRDANLRNPNGVALNLDRAEIAGNLDAFDGFTASGGVRALGASIKGKVDFNGARLRNCGPDKEALNLTGAQISRGVIASKGFTTHGEVRAVGATIKGTLDFCGAKIFSCDRDALNLNRVEIAGDLLACDGFESHGAVRAMAAQIGGQVDLSDATLRHLKGDALRLRSASMRRLVLTPTVLEGVDLTRAAIGDLKTDSDLPGPLTATGWKVADIQGPLRDQVKAARKWLSTAPTDKTPIQPFWALAEVYERNGDPAAARCMRFSAASKATWQSPRPGRYFRAAYGLLVGYGFYPLAAIFWIFVVVGLGWGLISWQRQNVVPTYPERAIAAMYTVERGSWGNRSMLGQAFNSQFLVPERKPPTAATSCDLYPRYPCWNSFTFTVNSLVPAWGSPGPDWTVAPNGPNWLTVALALLKMIAWGLVGILLAGVTGLLRRT